MSASPSTNEPVAQLTRRHLQEDFPLVRKSRQRNLFGLEKQSQYLEQERAILDNIIPLIPAGVELLILPRITSDLKGRKTTSRNSTESCQSEDPFCDRRRLIPLTFTIPVPCPIRPSEADRRSYRHMPNPTF